MCLLSASAAARADTQWIESQNGDLSNLGTAPTELLLSAGKNRIIGTTGNGGAGIDRDFFSFVVASGASVTALTLLDNTQISGSASFLAIKAGPRIDGDGPTSVDGFVHYDLSMVGQNLLPVLGFAQGLHAGAYTFWLQETGGLVNYGLQFSLTPAPTPVPLPGLAPWAFALLSSVFHLNRYRRLQG